MLVEGVDVPTLAAMSACAVWYFNPFKEYMLAAVYGRAVCWRMQQNADVFLAMFLFQNICIPLAISAVSAETFKQVARWQAHLGFEHVLAERHHLLLQAATSRYNPTRSFFH